MGFTVKSLPLGNPEVTCRVRPRRTPSGVRGPGHCVGVAVTAPQTPVSPARAPPAQRLSFTEAVPALGRRPLYLSRPPRGLQVRTPSPGLQTPPKAGHLERRLVSLTSGPGPGRNRTPARVAVQSRARLAGSPGPL